jgi:hypothetical protein
MHVMLQNGSTAAKSASSSTTWADLPPSSRKTFFTVSPLRAMMWRPTAVEPVKEIMSTRGSPVRASPTRAASPDVTTLKTPGGMSVCSAATRARKVALQGVSGAGLSTIAFPAARAGPTLARFTCSGKFQGVMQPTTPVASL